MTSFLRFLDHTQRRTTVGRTPLDEWSARRRDLYLTTHDTHNRQTSIPPVGFEPTISAGERPQTYEQDATVYQNFISSRVWSSTCFGRYTAHHQKPKTSLAAPGFAYVEGCWKCSCWTLSADSIQQLHVQQPSVYAKPEAASAVLGPWWWAVCRPKHAELHINMK